MDVQTKSRERNVPVATEQMVIFELDQEEYAVPILEVKEVVTMTTDITPVPQSSASILGIINLRGKIIPVLDLEKRFSLQRDSAAVPEHVLIVEEAQVPFGILVDRVSEVLKVEVDHIQPAPRAVTSKIAADFVKGVIVLEHPTERVVLILDLAKVLQDDEVAALKNL
jgi:purine-binding chemotaxis protein CheW